MRFNTRTYYRFNSADKLPSVETSHKHQDMTIPNESYSLKELVKKHKAGMMPPIERQAIWQDEASHDDLDLQEVHSMDMTEQTEIIENNHDLVEQLKKTSAELEITPEVENEQIKEANEISRLKAELGKLQSASETAYEGNVVNRKAETENGKSLSSSA